MVKIHDLIFEMSKDFRDGIAVSTGSTDDWFPAVDEVPRLPMFRTYTPIGNCHISDSDAIASAFSLKISSKTASLTCHKAELHVNTRFRI